MQLYLNFSLLIFTFAALTSAAEDVHFDKNKSYFDGKPISEVATALNHHNVADHMARSSAQSSAVAVAASKAPVSYGSELLRSGSVDRIALNFNASNKAIEKSIDASQIQKTKFSLPSLEQMGSDLRVGKFVVTSDRGEEIILLIRSLATHPISERGAILNKLQTLSEKGFPEASNFMGVIFEYGLFGANVDFVRAKDLYMSAAKKRYQAAIFNLANNAYFGKSGKRNLQEAHQLIAQAYAVGPENSYRVCGLASFIEYTQGRMPEAVNYGKSCLSPLSNIPNALLITSTSMEKRIEMLRSSISTGADDGFDLLEKITFPNNGASNHLYCKYKLVNHYRFSGKFDRLKELAKECYEKTTPNSHAREEKFQSDTAITGIIGFVTFEVNSLLQMRQSNHFHYSWSVPYLPFPQSEVDMFESIMPKRKL